MRHGLEPASPEAVGERLIEAMPLEGHARSRGDVDVHGLAWRAAYDHGARRRPPRHVDLPRDLAGPDLFVVQPDNRVRQVLLAGSEPDSQDLPRDAEAIAGVDIDDLELVPGPFAGPLHGAQALRRHPRQRRHRCRRVRPRASFPGDQTRQDQGCQRHERLLAGDYQDPSASAPTKQPSSVSSPTSRSRRARDISM